MVQALSAFEQLKKQANLVLTQATSQDPQSQTDPAQTKQQILLADEIYQQALQIPDITNKEKSSLYKNLIKVNYELSRIEPVRQIKLHFFDQAMEMADKALYFGLESQEQSWVTELIQRGGDSYMSQIKLLFTGEGLDNRATYLESLFVRMNKSRVDLAMRLAWYLSKAYQKTALSRYDKKNYKGANHAIGQAIQFFNIHLETFTNNRQRYPFLNEFKSDEKRDALQKSTWKFKRIVQAEIELLSGQNYFNEAIFDSENLDMDGIYDSIDCCNMAQKTAFELEDTELEVRCEAFLGKIYYMGVKKIDKAKRHLSNTMRLEITLRPKTFQNEAWFVASKVSLEAITRQLLADEANAIAAEERPHLEALAEDLTKLKEERKKDAQSFLKYVHANYIPEDKKFELTEVMLNEGQIKRTITIKFSKIFHPDRNVNEEKKIQVLRQEIQKHLSSFIEEYRCGE